MFDLTLLKEDKDSYIIDVFLNDDGTYTVKYANGEEEVFPFSIHNFQVELYRMEEQFRKYGVDYLDKVYPNGTIKSSLLAMMLVVDVVYFEFILEEGLNFARGWIFGYAIYSFITRLIPHLKSRKLFLEAKKKIAIIKLYLENKEKFKVNVINPHNGKEDDWYLVDLASIDDFESEEELNRYIESLTEENKKSKAEEVTLKLKRCVEGSVVL